MPSKSRAQQRLMQAVLHGADFPKARQVRESMSSATLEEFAKRVDGESHSYDWRQRQGLKQNRDR